MAEHSIHADQRLERLDHRRLSDVYRDEDEVERNEDAVEPRSRPTDPSRQQGTRVLSRADIGTEEESNNSLKGSGQIVGKRGGNGKPLPFLAGEPRSPSLHDDSYLQHKQQKKMCVKCMI